MAPAGRCRSAASFSQASPVCGSQSFRSGSAAAASCRAWRTPSASADNWKNPDSGSHAFTSSLFCLDYRPVHDGDERRQQQGGGKVLRVRSLRLLPWRILFVPGGQSRGSWRATDGAAGVFSPRFIPPSHGGSTVLKHHCWSWAPSQRGDCLAIAPFSFRGTSKHLVLFSLTSVQNPSAKGSILQSADVCPRYPHFRTPRHRASALRPPIAGSTRVHSDPVTSCRLARSANLGRSFPIS